MLLAQKYAKIFLDSYHKLKKEKTMKPLFAIDLTEDLNNDIMNVEPFLAQRLTINEITGVSELRAVGRHAVEETEIEPAEEVTLTRREQRKLSRIERRMKRAEKKRLREEKKRLYDEQFYDVKTKKRIALMRALDSAYSEMGVPADADDVDVFSFSYIRQGENIIPVITPRSRTHYVNLPMKMYVKNRELYISDLSRAYAFSLDSMRTITKVKEKIVFPFWHRDMPHDDSLYSPFGIKYRKFRKVYQSKYYYVLTLEEGGEEYSLMFAPYDLAAFERLAEVSCRKR